MRGGKVGSKEEAERGLHQRSIDSGRCDRSDVRIMAGFRAGPDRAGGQQHVCW